MLEETRFVVLTYSGAALWWISCYSRVSPSGVELRCWNRSTCGLPETATASGREKGYGDTDIASAIGNILVGSCHRLALHPCDARVVERCYLSQVASRLEYPATHPERSCDPVLSESSLASLPSDVNQSSLVSDGYRARIQVVDYKKCLLLVEPLKRCPPMTLYCHWFWEFFKILLIF